MVLGQPRGRGRGRGCTSSINVDWDVEPRGPLPGDGTGCASVANLAAATFTISSLVKDRSSSAASRRAGRAVCFSQSPAVCECPIGTQELGGGSGSGRSHAGR